MRIPLRGPGNLRARGTIRIAPGPVAVPSEPPSSPGGPLVLAPAVVEPASNRELLRSMAALLVAAPLPRTARTPALPWASGVPPEVIREGDRAEFDGNEAWLELPGVEEIAVVTSFLEREDGRILVLRRSPRVGSFQGRWAGVSGYLENDLPGDRAVTEIREETGVAESELGARTVGSRIYARDGGRVFVVHPFRFKVRSPKVRLDWEHTEFRWIDPRELRRLDTVPRLQEVWNSVMDAGDSRPSKTLKNDSDES